MKTPNQKSMKKNIVLSGMYILIVLIVVQLVAASSQQISIPLIDTANGAVIGEARATLALNTESSTQYTLIATNQVYTLNNLANFVGFVTATAKLSPTSSLPGRASSSTNRNQAASGQFDDMTITVETDQSTTQIIVTYEVGGNGNTPATDDSQDPITVAITGKKETIFTRETTTPQPQPPADGGDQPKTEVLCSCSPCGQNICATKDVRECPAAVKAEQAGGTVSLFANKKKISYGNWDGGVARSDAGKFAGTCTGCSNLFPILLADVKARDRTACTEACNIACTGYKTKYQDQAQVDADRAAQECFDWITDTCSTVAQEPAKAEQKKESDPNELKEEQKPKTEEALQAAQEPQQQEQQKEPPKEDKGVVTTVVDWVKSIWEWIFGPEPKQPEPPKQKLCTCLCEKDCTTIKTDGCTTAEQTEKTGGGKIFEWGVVTGKVPNGDWSGLVKKQPDGTFKKECTMCRDAINIADVLSDADGNCDNPCKNVCKNNADAINNRARSDCQARLREACA